MLVHAMGVQPANSKEQGRKGSRRTGKRRRLPAGQERAAEKRRSSLHFPGLAGSLGGGVSSLTNETSGLRCEMQRGGRAAEGISGCVLDAASCICAASVPTLASQCISHYQGPATTCQKPGKTHGRRKPPPVFPASNVDICAAFCDTVD